MTSSFQHIGYQGSSLGLLILRGDSIQWKDKLSSSIKEISASDIQSASWTVFGQKGHIKLSTKDGVVIRLDGFQKSDFSTLSQHFREDFKTTLTNELVACEGTNHGNLLVEGKTLSLKSAKYPDRTVFDIPLDKISQSVLSSNKNEIEIQLQQDGDEDGLTQVTFHFPKKDKRGETEEGEENNESDHEDDEDGTGKTQGQKFYLALQSTGAGGGVSSSSSIICEFSSEQGRFVSPRGQYSIQICPDFFRMQGAKYTYLINYTDVQALYLLPKPNRTHSAFLLSLTTPLSQGAQRYYNLVMELHKTETSVKINLSEEEIQSQYEGMSTPTMTSPLSTLLPKIFKLVSKVLVFTPKHFNSVRGSPCVRCNVKANDGFLYLLAKCFIFINKPTLIIRFEDVESLEFQRYHDKNLFEANKNFDLCITVKSSHFNHESSATTGGTGQEREFVFASIERPEYAALKDFFTSKSMKLINEPRGGDSSGKPNLSELLSDEDGSGSDDGSYDGSSSSSDSDSDSGSGSDSDTEDKKKDVKSEKKTESDKKSSSSSSSSSKSSSSSSSSSSSKPKEKTQEKEKEKTKEKEKEKTKEKGKEKEKEKEKPAAKEKPSSKEKDKDAPKKAKSGYSFFLESNSKTVKAENPSLDFSSLSRMMGERWKALSAEERKPYETMAEKDKLRFSDAQETYKAMKRDRGDEDSGDEDKQSKKTSKTKGGKGETEKKKKDKNAPKAPSSSYILFSNANRAAVKAENPSLSVTQISSELGLRWKVISPEEKKKFEDLAKIDKERYAREMKDYKERLANGEGESGGGGGGGGGGGNSGDKKRDPSLILKLKKSTSASPKEVKKEVMEVDDNEDEEAESDGGSGSGEENEESDNEN